MIEEPYKADVEFAMEKAEIEEDTHFLYFTDWKMWYNITINDDAVDISTFALTNESRKEFVDTYKGKLFQHHILHGINSHLKLQQVPLNEYGVPVAILEVHDGSKWTPHVMKYTNVDIVKHNYRIKFTESCNCQFNVELLHPGANSNNDLMVIKVMAVNDAPVLTDRAILRYNELVETYLLYPYVHQDTDFRISDIVPHFYSDEDEHGIIGAAIIGQISDKIGKWMFSHNSSWTSFPYLDKSDLPGRSNINVHLLGPDDIIRFVPNNSSYLWTRHEAIAYTRIYLLGWDMSNSNNETQLTDIVDIHKCHGIHNKICGPGGKSAFGRDVIALYINRVGCDGMASSLMSADSCGICGGHDDCIDCTGIPHGGASYDMCRDCTGGSSSIPYGHHLDCNHECGNNYYEQRLQMCVRNGTDVQGLLTLMSCDSMLNSGAYINKQCCQWQQKKEDFCGQCLHPSDSNYNKGCMKLGSVSPNYLRNFDNHTLYVVGVKLDMFSTVECSLHKHNDIYLSVLNFDNKTSTIELQTPDLLGTRGEYNISCLFDSNTTLVLENELTIYQYPHITSINPDSMVIGDMIKVNITTDGVVDTGYTQCILLCPFRSPEIGCYTASGFSKVHIPIVLLNSKTVQCDLSQLRYFNRAKAYKILVAVEQKEILDLTRLQSTDFIIRAEAPVIQAAVFDRSFCYFSVVFNRDITGPNECSDIFHSDTYSLFGTDPHCITVGKRVLVDLGRDNTLRPGHTITLKTSAIYRIGAMQQYAEFATGSKNISIPVNAMQPQFSLTGPSVVGSCDAFNVVLKQTNSGCMKFRSHWSIQANPASGNTSWVNSTSFTSFMNKIHDMKNSPRMLAVHHDEVQPGENVEFSVTVEDDLNGLSYVARHNVSREMTMNPLSVSLMLLGDTAHVDPANIIRFYATAKVPECYNLTEEIVKFSWQSGTSDFSLSVFNDKPIAAVRPNTLRGGSMYTVTIIAFFEDVPAAEAVDLVTFHTISKPLNVIIDGGDFMVFAPHQEVVLDAGVSQDPDRQNLPKFFTWTCKYASLENGFPCLIAHGNDTVHMSSVFTFNERIVIPVNTLAVGDKMMWTATMTVGQRTGNYTTTVEIVNVLPPSLVLQLTNIIVNPGDKLRIPCTVTSHGPVMMMWSSSSDNGFDSIDLSTILPSESILQESKVSVTNKDFSLFLDLSGIATLPAGATFVFVVTAFALDNEQSSEKRVHVTVNSPPTTGDVQISPSNGTSMTTDFTIDVGDGWTDIDGDSTLFFFSVKEANLDRIRLNARGLSDVYSYMFKLTEGVYDVIVELCDTYGACSNVNLKAAITVLGKTFTEAELDQAAASITATLKTDMNAAIGMAMTMSSLLVTDNQNSTDSVSLVINEVATSLLISVVAAVDPADATSVLDSANNMLQRLADSGGLAQTVITESQSLASDLASYVTTGTGQSRRRKKRTTTVDITPLPINNAAVLLTTYSATFSQQSEDSISTNSATDYHQSLDNIFIGLCATVAYAEDPVVISSTLTTINIDKRVTENTESLVYDVTCKNCTSFITHPAHVTYGISIQNKYASWDCSPYLSCYGACFVSAQLTKDLVTPTSPSEMSLTNRVRRSDIIILKVINPVENSILTVGNLETPITITIRVDGDVNTTAYSLQCLFWNHDSWTNNTCTASSPHMIDLMTAVTCSCDTMGYIAIFEGPPIIETIISTSTESSLETETVPVHEGTTETIISIPSSAEAVQVSFTIDTDYAIIVDHVQFRNEIKQKLADTMHVKVKRITYLSVESGSIIVTFKVEHGSVSETTIQVAVEKLLAAIMSNNLAITNHHGGPLKIIKASFTYEVVDKDPVPEEENPSTLYIILGCVGALLVIAVVVIAILLHKMKKDHTAVSTSPPPPYGPQMHGVDVPRPVSSGSKKLLVQERTNSKIKQSNDKHGCGKMYDTGHGSAMKDVDIVAIEKGAGIQCAVYGQPGEKWTEIEIRPNSRPGSASSIPGPPKYLPPITG
ncbi:unnamed protein product [Mytilus edulis]|uniref:PKD/REJ-like domain-containing protein n=1 Tax=Mytilus edulis TaxID=6550 RepID=A0A8S3TSZ6_MYTED|nr:unnamed protein product [Mytilus edulis]